MYFFDSLSALILFSSIILMANKRIKSYIRTFRIQSLLIGVAAGFMAAGSSVEEGRVDFIVLCLLILVLKAYFIPNLLAKTYANLEYRIQKDFFLNIPILVLMCCGLVVITYFSLSAAKGIDSGILDIEMVNSVSVILIGLLFMISRKKAIGQIIGFLVIENGLFVTALFATNGMPFIVDLGIFIDLLTAIIIVRIMVFRIDREFDTIDLNRLRHLRG